MFQHRDIYPLHKAIPNKIYRIPIEDLRSTTSLDIIAIGIGPFLLYINLTLCLLIIHHFMG